MKPQLLGLLLLGSSLGAQGTLSPTQEWNFVEPPPGWYSGDTHELIQLCATAGTFPPDRPLTDVVQEMLDKRLNVSSVLVLVTGNISCNTYLSQYVPMVTGMEDPITSQLPGYALQFGCEVVGGSDPNCAYPAWGHVSGLGIDDAAYLMTADYPGPNLEFFQSQPRGISGYAHVAWPEGTRSPEDFPPIARGLTRVYPLLAPMDIALGRVDFVSTPDVPHEAKGIAPVPWWGLWYKLLDVGFDTAITGGTVAQCYNELIPLDARTWVEIESEPLTYDKWTAGIAKGRTVIADGVSDFIDLKVDGLGPGRTKYVFGSTPVQIEATLRFGEPRATTLEILQGGEVIASETIASGKAGEHTLRTTVTLGESDWIAARTKRVHTGAVRVFVDTEPITDSDTADYFIQYERELVRLLDSLAAICNACSVQTCRACIEFERWVGVSEAAIRTDLARTIDHYRARRDYGSEPPGVARFGLASPSCEGPSAIGVRGKGPLRAGNTVKVTAFGAPPKSLGVLGISIGALQQPVHFRGADIWIGLNPLPRFLPLKSDGGGYAEIDLLLPPTMSSAEGFLQFFWRNGKACTGWDPWSSSAAMSLRYHRGLFLEK